MIEKKSIDLCMTLKKNHISPIFKKLKINQDWTDSDTTLESLYLSKAENSDFLTSPESTPDRIESQNLSFNKTEQTQTSQEIADRYETSLSNNAESEFKPSVGSGNLTGYSRIQELKLVKIGIASSEQIMSWAEKLLPNGKIFGEVLNANTLHYKTFKPQKGGLFCQRIFGPLKDFECACGIVRKPSSEESLVQNLLQQGKTKRTYCSVCDVEYTWSVIRRYQLGYIKLASPVTHLWYLKANPSYLSLLLDMRKKDLEDIIYCTHTLTLEDYWRPLRSAPMTLNPSLFFESYKKYLTTSTFDDVKEDSLTFSMRKRFEEKKKRQNYKPRRRTISYLHYKTRQWDANSDEPAIPLLAHRSKKDQIESLETAYLLSSDNEAARKFSRLTHVARILMEKKISNIKKDYFLTARSKSLEEFYKRTFYGFCRKSFLSFFELKNHLKTTTNSFLQKNKNHENIQVSTLVNSSLKIVLKNHLNKSLALKTKAASQKNKKILPRWGAGNYYRYVKTKTQSNMLEPKTPSLSDPSGTLTKNSLLTVFLNLIRKSNPTENWESIYNAPLEAAASFTNQRKNLSKNWRSYQIVFNLFEHVFSNSVILYLLFVLQNGKKSTFISNFLMFEKQFLVQALVTESTANFLNLEHIQSLKDCLKNEEMGPEKISQGFIETESILRNTNLTKFTSLSFQFILKAYLTEQVLQSSYFYKKKTFKIFFVKKNPEDRFWQTQGKVLFSGKKPSLYSIERTSSFSGKEKTEKKIEKLLKKRQISSFVKNGDNYPEDTIAYLKNLVKMKNEVRHFKAKKPSGAFKLFNNIYTTSYFEAWETEKDWKYFLYYSKSIVEDSDRILPGYEYRFPNVSSLSSTQSYGKVLPIIGANLVQKLLFQYEGTELKKMAKQHQNVVPKLNRYLRYRKQTAVKKSDYADVQKLLQTRDDLIRRLKLLRKLFKKNTKTSSMVLNTVPVLPPDLRPILKMQNQIAASDLNRFYQRILYRNDRLKKFIRANAAMMNPEPAFEVKYAQRLLQEAVDNLIQNGKGQVKPETNSRGQPLKSLSEILKGKQGRFRQYLLGKRVDYSGRSVIVVGPTLKIYECGLPFEMAMELFLPFLIKRIFQYGYARTVMGAKTILKNDHKTTWNLLEEIMQHHPILLNRAPTLHRLGIQAFRPKLISGRAILLHPLVCPAFNADFDGDQMAVHVPITVEARTEAWKLMFSRNHLVSPATGEPMLLPTQDMVLGCYYLTTTSPQNRTYNVSYPFPSVTDFYFSTMKEILQAYLQERIHLQTPIWMRWNGLIQLDQNTSQPYEIRVMADGSWVEIQSEYHRKWNLKGEWDQLFVRTTPGRIIFNLMVQNCIETKS